MGWFDYTPPGFIIDKGKKAIEWGKKQTEEGGYFGDPAGTKFRFGQGEAAGQFAGEGERGFRKLGHESALQRRYMEDIARGRESVSAMQLKNALGQNVAGQQAMAASARPGQGAMGARSAMMNAGRMGAGLAGQQATAGIQERQSAQNALNNMLLQQRAQDMQVALNSRSNALGINPQGASGVDKQMGALTGAAGWAM
jgi:hypothetical protein